MSESLKKQGWKNMEAILDKELPKDKKNNKFLYWLLIPALIFGFGLGYIAHGVTMKPPIQPGKPELVQPPVTSMVLEQHQTKEDPTNTDLIQSTPNHIFNQKTVTLKPIIQDNPATSLTSPGIYNSPLNNQQTGTDEPLTSAQSFQVEDFGTENVVRILIPPFRKLHGLLVDIPYLTNKLNPIIEISSKWKLFQQISLEAGSNWQKPTAQSGAIFYRLGWKNNNAYVYTSLGYRYINYDISEKIDTLPNALTNAPFTPNEALQNQTSLQVGSVHQIIPALGLGYYFSPSWFADLSLRLPLNINFKNNPFDLVGADQENTGPGYSPVFKNIVATQNEWDVQTCFTLGKKIYKNLSVTASASIGFIPIHAQALLSGKNLKYNQYAAGLVYNF